MQQILVLLNNSGVGGAERRMGRLFARMAMDQPNVSMIVNKSLWEQLQAAGIVSETQVRIYVFREPFAWMARGVAALNQTVALWVRKLDYLLIALWLWGRYCFSPPVLFHAVLGGAYAVLPLILVRPGHRYVLSVTDPNLANIVGNRAGLWLYLWGLRHTTVIDALTEAICDELVRAGLDRRKIMVSPGSVVDVNRFRPDRPKEPWVIFAGRLVDEKNPLLFVEAIPAIHAAVPEAKFFIYGCGPLLATILERLTRLGLHRIVAMGFENDLSLQLARSSVFVSLQRRDNYPSQSLLEAMACELAVVATDVGMTRRLVDERTGISVTPDSVHVADAVVQLLQDFERCTHLGAMGRQRVLAQHSEGQYGAYLEWVYRTASGEDGRYLPVKVG